MITDGVHADQASDVRVVLASDAVAGSAPVPRATHAWRQVGAILTVVASAVAGVALVRPFEAALAYQKAIAAADAADLDDAEAHVKRAISWTPQDAYLYRFLGEIYYRKALFRPRERRDYLDQAVVAFERSAQLNPDEAGTYTLIGWTYLYRGDALAAEAAFLEANALDPNNPYVRYSLGTAYLWQKKLTEARAEMMFAHRYMPAAPEVLAALQEIERLEGSRSP